MRSASLFLPLLLAGCVSLGHCGPTYHGVQWAEPEFASILRDVQPEGWDVYSEPRPHGFPVEHPWLDGWNASITSILYREEGPQDGDGHHDRHDAVNVHLAAPARISLHLLADRNTTEARPAVLHFLQLTTDGNETERGAWADELLSGHDLPEGVDYPAPEHRHFTLVPYELDLPTERLRVQAFVDEHFHPDGTRPAVALEDWSVSVDFPETIAVRGTQEFRASPRFNEYRNGTLSGDESREEVLADFHAAYASLGVGPAPQDVEMDASIC